MGCALFYQEDDGPTTEQLKAIEHEYRVREQKQAEAFSKKTSIISEQNTLVMNAMIGQVNGNAIYADDVLKNAHDQLVTLGKNLSRRDFLEEIRGNAQKPGIIEQNIRAIVTNALIYGDAERNLSNNERFGVKMYVKQNREFLVRKFGQGSYALADKTLREKTGMSLEQNLEEQRRGFIIQRYIDQKIRPLVNVSRGDVERYYRDHPEIFNPPALRDIRLIGVSNADTAANIETQLKNGTPFKDIATGPLNEKLRSRGGLMPNLQGDAPFTKALDLLNKKLADLKQGDYTQTPTKIGRTYWFVCVEKMQQGEYMSLRDAQLRIEEVLKAQQFKMHVDRYNSNLLKEGSYDDMRKMTNTLIQIAMNRYAQPE